MSIAAVTGFSLTSQAAATAHNRQNLPGASGTGSTGFSTDLAAAQAAHNVNNTPLAQASNYFKELPAQRLQDNWLSQHGITQAQFNSMNSADRQTISNQMKQDIEAKMKQKLGSAAGTSGSTTASVNMLA